MDVREKLVELPIEDAILILREEHRQRTDGYATHLAHGGKGDPAEEVSLDALAMAISALEKTKWISVDDRLPEKDGKYLVWFGKNVVKQYAKVISFAKDGDTVDTYDLHDKKNVWFYYDSECGYLACHDVTHWMPIPHPPKGE